MALEMWKKKAGPLPMWGWGGILLGGALLYSLVSRGRSAKDSGNDTGPTDTSTVPSDQVPDFISQVYTTVNNAAPATPTTPATPPTTTLPAPVTSPPVSPPKTVPRTTPILTNPAKPAAKATEYKVKHGDTLSSIAKKYGTTWQALWAYNTKSGVRPADTIKTLKARGPNKLYANETILIPPK